MEFHRGGVHLPELGLWLDASEPQTGPERVFVSHAHSDHMEAHREVILSAPTARLMRARMEGERVERVLDFGNPAVFVHEEREFRITLLPAGHIFGSAMSLIEADGGSLLYTGDFKLRRGLSAEPCEPRRADVLVMETTYGRPEYVFPPTEQVLQSVIRFCREALDNDETAVLLGYTLGKSQELLCGLSDAGFPLMLHGAVHRLTQIYEEFGRCFPKYERYEAGSARGKVLLCPPNVANTAMLRNLGTVRSAILTGWAVDPNCRYRYQCDAAFPLSDHADYNELIEFVRRVRPRKVWTLHGFAADFARTLRDLGVDAQALSEQEQFVLKLEDQPAAARKIRPREFRATASGRLETGRAALPFARFAEVSASIAQTASKIEKARLLSDYLRELWNGSQVDEGSVAGAAPQDTGPGTRRHPVAIAATWFSGRPFPAADGKVLKVGWAALRDALCEVAGVDAASFHQAYLRHSDLGETAFEILQGREGEPALSVDDVDRLFHELHVARGPLARRPLLASALARCSALEAKYLVKIVTGDLRIGLKEGLVEEGIGMAFDVSPDEVRQAHLLLGDIGETARHAAAGRLCEASLVPFRPIRFMLASPEETAADVRERMRDSGAGEPGPDESASALWLEDKYDGIRCQLHRAGNRVALYSRDLKDVTATFIEIADAARKVLPEVVLDGELVAMRGEEILPFAELQRRLGRREHDLFMREEVPIRFVAFDLLWLEGRSWLRERLRERRRRLEELRLSEPFELARISEARSVADIDRAFEAARARGNEGLMIKDPESGYLPGRRGLAWLKLKKALATLDCVVVGAEYGHGKRHKVLSDYTFAVRDEQTGELKTIGKAYSGLTDAEIEGLTRHFLSMAVRRYGRYLEVRPDTVLEIAFDRLQASRRHSSGLAMRFPRIVRIRSDKSPQDIDTLATARKLAAGREAGRV
ncbi:MAG TPA: ATP-dependent DNA ligase [Verrucomicrobiota bacterium]|nr:ATP-dependent DNA ligase [Verrucomicrobiota bacterium]